MNPIIAAKLRSLLQSLSPESESAVNPAEVQDAQQPVHLTPGAGTSAAAATAVQTPAATPTQQRRVSTRGKEPAPEEPEPAPIAAQLQQRSLQHEDIVQAVINSNASVDEKMELLERVFARTQSRGAAGPSNAAVSHIVPETVQLVSAPVVSVTQAAQVPVHVPAVPAPAHQVATVPIAVMQTSEAPHVQASQVQASNAAQVAAQVAAPASTAVLPAPAPAPSVPAPAPVQQAAPVVPMVPGVQQRAPVPLSVQLAMSAPSVPAPAIAAPMQNTPRLQFKLPAPEKFNGKIGGNIVDLEVWGDDIKLFAAAMHIPIRQAMTMLTTSTARQHVSNMGRMPECNTLSEDKFLDKFIMHFKGQSKDRAETARDKLFDNEVKQQPGQTVTEYESYFNQVALDAHDMPQRDLIRWFKHGLLPEVREGLTPPAGQRIFRSLAELVTAAQLQEEFLKESIRNAKVPKLAAIQSISYSNRRSFSRTKQGDNGKRANSEQWQTAGANKNKKARHDNNSKQSGGLTFTVYGPKIDKEMEELRQECWRTGKCTNCQQQGCSIKNCKVARTSLGEWMDARRKVMSKNRANSG